MNFTNVPKAFRTKLAHQKITALPAKPIIGILGDPNTGKSHLATDLCYRYLDAHPRHRGLWVTAEELLTKYHQAMAAGNQGMEGALKMFLRADLLLIDDLFATGRQLKSPGADTLADLISRRTNEERITVWTSNWSKSRIRSEVDHRLSDRLLNEERGTGATILKDRIIRSPLTEEWNLPEPEWYTDATSCYSERRNNPWSSYVPYMTIKEIPEAIDWLREHCGQDYLDTMNNLKIPTGAIRLSAGLLGRGAILGEQDR